jgi:ABC-2 type transport system ATP-binding protein
MQSGDPIIQTAGLSKRYGNRVLAVHELTLSVGRGQVYGFLGPNGAGKTTTLRMLTGLIRPSAGSALVAGYPAGSPASLARIGYVVENPVFYPYLSGRDNLRTVAHYANVDQARVEPVLGMVGLASGAGRRYRTYSLGMKQRLSIAAALIKEPELLIMDEPTNGLDPEGMVAIRNLVREFGSGGRTVFLSSHLLGEVEQICDRVAVIRHGQLVAEGTIAEVRTAVGGTGGVSLRAEPIEVATAVLRRKYGEERVRVVGDTITVAVEPGAAAELNRELAGAGVNVSEMRPVERSLEEAFLQLTRSQDGEVARP